MTFKIKKEMSHNGTMRFYPMVKHYFSNTWVYMLDMRNIKKHIDEVLVKKISFSKKNEAKIFIAHYKDDYIY